MTSRIVHRAGHLGQALASGAIVAGWVVGVPMILWNAVGMPVPDQVLSWTELRERLAAPVTDPALLDILALIGWGCWAVFTTQVIREISWYALHLPHLAWNREAHQAHMTGLSPMRWVAAATVGAALLSVLAAIRPATAVPPTTEALRTPVIAAASQPTSPPKHEPAEDRRRGEPVITYTAVEGDTLWDLATRHLGEGVKWPRIWAINKDRPQPGGQRLTDPNALRPGWQLLLPALTEPNLKKSATEPPAAPRPRVEGAPTTPDPAGPAPTSNRPKRAAHPSSKTDTVGDRGSAAISLGEAGVIGVTTAASLLAARRVYRIRRTRRLTRTGRPDGDPVPRLTPVVDLACQAAREATLASPSSDPDALLTRRPPPATPHADSHVTIGTRDGAEITIDVMATSGGHSFTGPGAEAVVRALLTAILAAAARTSALTCTVTAGLPAHLAHHLLPDTEGWTCSGPVLTATSDDEQLLELAEAHLLAHARHHSEASAEHPRPDPGLLIVMADRALTSTSSDRLRDMAACAKPGVLAVLTLHAALPGAAVWEVTADGYVRAQPPEHEAHVLEGTQLFHLTQAATADVATYLARAQDDEPPDPPSLPDSLEGEPLPEPESTGTPTATGSEADQGGSGLPLDGPQPSPAVSPTPIAPIAQNSQNEAPEFETTEALCPQADTRDGVRVRICLLGPMTVRVPGRDEPVCGHLRSEAREFLALLATHPAGLVSAEVARHLRLDGNADQIAHQLKNLRRAVRRALRTATGNGKAEFLTLFGELHKLSPTLVRTDIAEFNDAVKNSTKAVDELHAEALSKVLDAYHGPVLNGVDWLWVEPIRENCIRDAVGAVVKLAQQAKIERSITQDAVAHLERLISWHPDIELLYQHVINLHMHSGRSDAARRTYVRLRAHLSDLGLEPDPSTRALLGDSVIARADRSRKARPAHRIAERVRTAGSSGAIEIP
ncbi:LysM peptidoglycan-binding domain-containing protein [Streptomyces sp. AJS327]|uniref:BTAD domain-containing putative transcriptional regulator n=1 Tax=Streptomyces sp. AJS327 TaxID=2545265 RepID=UPI0015DFCBBB|nr:BTAD domain-containing putative transcriptional regulator [Streptomyces sp. AJS327]MBA0049775.1 LysM peptidoglycan-binding domain-containing protein [Streptomyces sp. AJS327]